MTDKDERIAKLSQRFKTHRVGRPKQTQKNRERQSFYLDTELTERMDRTYKDSKRSPGIPSYAAGSMPCWISVGVGIKDGAGSPQSAASQAAVT